MADPNSKPDVPPPSFEDALASPAVPLTSSTAAASSAGSAFRTRFACVTLNQRDRIRFISFPADIVSAMRTVIASAWYKGISESRSYAESHEFKLHGSPWKAESGGYDDARRLVRRLLEALFDKGWVLQAAVGISKKELDKDSLVFRYQNPAPPPCEWLSISFDRQDRLKIVDIPPPDLRTALVKAYGSMVSRHEVMGQHFEIKFHGNPWWPSGGDAVTTRVMLIKLLETLEEFGFSLYASVDQSNSHDGHETDVLVVHRQKNWIPGTPIWHR